MQHKKSLTINFLPCPGKNYGFHRTVTEGRYYSVNVFFYVGLLQPGTSNTGVLIGGNNLFLAGAPPMVDPLGIL